MTEQLKKKNKKEREVALALLFWKYCTGTKLCAIRNTKLDVEILTTFSYCFYTLTNLKIHAKLIYCPLKYKDLQDLLILSQPAIDFLQ